MWYNIKPRRPEKNAPLYASLGGLVDGIQYVILSNGAYVNFTLTQEEARRRYVLGERCSASRSEEIEKRYRWEISR